MRGYLFSSAGMALSLALAPAANAAHSITYNPDPVTGAFTSVFENDDPLPTFDDVFTPFTILTGGFLSGTLGTVGIAPLNDLDFSFAQVINTVTGQTVLDFFPLTITPAGDNPDAAEQSLRLAQPIDAGTYSLRVSGTSPGENGSYAGTLAFTPAAVAAIPEPATWAMMLIGFGFLGSAMRRKKGSTTVRGHIRFA